eukprot:g19232.t1
MSSKGRSKVPARLFLPLSSLTAAATRWSVAACAQQKVVVVAWPSSSRDAWPGSAGPGDSWSSAKRVAC